MIRPVLWAMDISNIRRLGNELFLGSPPLAWIHLAGAVHQILFPGRGNRQYNDRKDSQSVCEENTKETPAAIRGEVGEHRTSVLAF